MDKMCSGTVGGGCGVARPSEECKAVRREAPRCMSPTFLTNAKKIENSENSEPRDGGFPSSAADMAGGKAKVAAFSNFEVWDLDCSIFFQSDELVIEIFQYLPVRKLVMCSEVSREWKRFSEDSVLWRRLCERICCRGLTRLRPDVRDALHRRIWKENYRDLICGRRYLTECGGGFYSAVVCSDAHVYVTGEFASMDLPTNGILMTPVDFSSVEDHCTVVPVTAGVYGAHFQVLDDRGRLYMWGFGLDLALGNGAAKNEDRPRRVEGLEDKFVVCASVGMHCAAAVTRDNLLYTWGSEFLGRSIVDQSTRLVPGVVPLSNVIDVSLGESHVLALTRQGTETMVYGWGDNSGGAVGIDSVHSHVYLGTGVPEPILIPELVGKGIVSVAAGARFSAAVSRRGVLYTWGRGTNGRLGHGNPTDVIVPRRVHALVRRKVQCVSLGSCHAIACTERGIVYTWGGNQMGQLGHGKFGNPHFVPKCLAVLRESVFVVAVSAGTFHSLAVSDDGKLFSWGCGEDGQCGQGCLRNWCAPRPVMLPQSCSVFGVLIR